jgi:DnaK suppressor protein
MTGDAALKARLEAQLAELEERLERVRADLAVPLDPDFSERAVEAEDDDSLEAQSQILAREIASFRRALARLEKGTYGECVRCGGRISRKRLEARPEAALCIACASAER